VIGRILSFQKALLQIDGEQFTYSNYQTILQTLRAIGMLKKENPNRPGSSVYPILPRLNLLPPNQDRLTHSPNLLLRRELCTGSNAAIHTIPRHNHHSPPLTPHNNPNSHRKNRSNPENQHHLSPLIHHNAPSPRTPSHTSNKPHPSNLRASQGNQSSAGSRGRLEISHTLHHNHPVPTCARVDHKHKTPHNSNTSHRNPDSSSNLHILTLRSKSPKQPRLRIAKTNISEASNKIRQHPRKHHCSMKYLPLMLKTLWLKLLES